MKFGILALDYDGTIAWDGVMPAEVRSAINDVRSRGIIVILVTGRILSELRNVAGDLRCFDAVVAENGAVVAFPDSGRSTALGPPPTARFLQELERRGVQMRAGECIVEANAEAAPLILSIIRELELPLVLLFNRGRVMILPQAISKATGLRYALRSLRLSEHNALAIGDAENDHQLLEACEVGVAAAWGSEALKSAADTIIPGTGPPAVAAYILDMATHRRLFPRRTARRLPLGIGEDGKPLSLAVQGRNVLIAGDSQTGKSWVAGLLCENLILQHYCVCVIDPEGDYRTLEALPGVIILGGDDPPPRAAELTRALRYPDVSVVLDLSRMKATEKKGYVKSVLSWLADMRRETGLPHRIVVDEAHYFLHDVDARDLLDADLAGYTLVTYQVSGINPSILAETEAIIVTRESDAREVRALRTLQRGCDSPADWEAALSNLGTSEAVLLPSAAEACGKLYRFTVAPRLTRHVRHEHKYVDMLLPESTAFVFSRGGNATGRRARSLKEFTSIVAETPPSALDGHLRNGDFSRWISQVFRDQALASDVHDLEKRYRVGKIADVNDALVRLVGDRYTYASGNGAYSNHPRDFL